MDCIENVGFQDISSITCAPSDNFSRLLYIKRWVVIRKSTVIHNQSSSLLSTSFVLLCIMHEKRVGNDQVVIDTKFYQPFSIRTYSFFTFFAKKSFPLCFSSFSILAFISSIMIVPSLIVIHITYNSFRTQFLSLLLSHLHLVRHISKNLANYFFHFFFYFYFFWNIFPILRYLLTPTPVSVIAWSFILVFSFP